MLRNMKIVLLSALMLTQGLAVPVHIATEDSDVAHHYSEHHSSNHPHGVVKYDDSIQPTECQSDCAHDIASGCSLNEHHHDKHHQHDNSHHLSEHQVVVNRTELNPVLSSAVAPSFFRIIMISGAVVQPERDTTIYATSIAALPLRRGPPQA